MPRGATVEVQGPKVEAWAAEVARENGFAHISHTIEIFGLFIKHSVLAVRLLANMMAGHLVLAVITAFIAALAVETTVALARRRFLPQPQ